MDDQQWDRPEAPADLMARLGNKTRTARQSRQLSRRALSELSGVSQRYLAQLEAGSGNMSIALLDKVATALGCDLAWLVSKQESPQWAEDSLEMRYHRLPDKLRCQIDTILEQASTPQGAASGSHLSGCAEPVNPRWAGLLLPRPALNLLKSMISSARRRVCRFPN